MSGSRSSTHRFCVTSVIAISLKVTPLTVNERDPVRPSPQAGYLQCLNQSKEQTSTKRVLRRESTSKFDMRLLKTAKVCLYPHSSSSKMGSLHCLEHGKPEFAGFSLLTLLVISYRHIIRFVNRGGVVIGTGALSEKLLCSSNSDMRVLKIWVVIVRLFVISKEKHCPE